MKISTVQSKYKTIVKICGLICSFKFMFVFFLNLSDTITFSFFSYKKLCTQPTQRQTHQRQTSCLSPHYHNIQCKKRKYPTDVKGGSSENNKKTFTLWLAQRFVAEPVGMCGTLMFLMKSTELHWSTGDESELSKAIRQVKDPLSALSSASEHDTAGAQGRAAKPPKANSGEERHTRTQTLIPSQG